MTPVDQKFLEYAIDLSRKSMESGNGGPFGCVVVKDGAIIGEGCNLVTSTNDPTAHAEVVAIRNACLHLKHFQLTGCDIYSSCEPCPMCLGAIYWTRPQRVIFANTKNDAAAIDFDDQFIYEEIVRTYQQRQIQFIHLPHPSAVEVFKIWDKMDHKLAY